MQKIMKIAIPILIIIFVLVGIAVLKRYNDGSIRIPENEPDSVGNTAGNLYNQGRFAESNGKVYFANPYDNDNLYVMNADQSEMTKLGSGDTSYINVIGDYIYFYSATSGSGNGLGYVRNGKGLYCCDITGKATYSLAKCETDSMMVVGNHIYFVNFGEADNAGNAIVTLDRTTTTNEGRETLINDHIRLGGFAYGNLYYGGMTSDHHLYAFNTSTRSVEQIGSMNVYMPIVSGSAVYYLDLDDDYHLKAYSLSDGSITEIVSERVDTYNVYNGIIYYQNCDPEAYALKRCSADGSNVQIIKEGVYRDISVTSTYVYFRDFNNDLPVYQMPTSGAPAIYTFDAAFNAAVQN